MRWLDGITHLMDTDLSKLGGQWRTGNPGVLQSTGSQRVRHDWATEQPQQWRAVQAPRDHFHPLYTTCTWVCKHVHTQENSAKRRAGCGPNRQSNKFCFSSFSCTHKICRRVLQLGNGENSGEASRKHLNLNLLLLLYLQLPAPHRSPASPSRTAVPSCPTTSQLPAHQLKVTNCTSNSEKVPAPKADKLERKALFVHFSLLWESYL